jgi:hypothetical protein
MRAFWIVLFWFYGFARLHFVYAFVINARHLGD